ncbi:MAG: hypothetical protein ACT4OM_04440 [Actinomycetota bacterium]
MLIGTVAGLIFWSRGGVDATGVSLEVLAGRGAGSHRRARLIHKIFLYLTKQTTRITFRFARRCYIALTERS